MQGDNKCTPHFLGVSAVQPHAPTTTAPGPPTVCDLYRSGTYAKLKSGLPTKETDSKYEADNRPNGHYPHVHPIKPEALLKWVKCRLKVLLPTQANVETRIPRRVSALSSRRYEQPSRGKNPKTPGPPDSGNARKKRGTSPPS